MRVHDRFRKAPVDGYVNAEYYRVVDQIETMIKARWPNNYASVLPIIRQIETDKTFRFSLLNGQVQAGKFLTANILMWILAIRYHLHVAYITKNLDLVRNDAIMKLERGYISDLIVSYCSELGLTRVETASFLLASTSGLDLGKQYDTALQQGKTPVSPGERVIPVYIMQGDNYRALFQHIKAVNANAKSHCVVVVDEVHELYTGTGVSADGCQLQPVGKMITGRHGLHKLYDMCKVMNVATLLGITATPERVLIKDPLCLVDSIYNLVPDPPFVGAVYYGYHDREARLLNVEVLVHEGDYTETVTKIIDRAPNFLANGHAEVKFIFICSEHLAADQAVVYEELKSEFGERIHCKMLIGDETAKSNGIPREHIARSLDEFFTDSLTEQICREGAVVLIADKMLAASATVKPSIGKVCTMRLSDGSCTYSLVGITDQIADIAPHIEAHKQKMRGHGWFPTGHQSRCWVPEDYVSDTESGVQQTHLDIMSQYDVATGPLSLSSISSSMSAVGHICPECPYRTTKRFGVQHTVSQAEPEGGVALQTRIYHPKYPDRWNTMTLGQLLYSAETKADRQELTRLLNPSGSRHHTPWPQKDNIGSRYNEILNACVQPKLGEEDEHWVVNSFTTCDSQSDLFNIPISKLFTVQFLTDYKSRPHWPTDACRSTCKSDLHVPLIEPIWFRVEDDYYVFRINKMMEHKYTEAYVDRVTTPAYKAVLDQIDRISEVAKVKPLRFYDLFGKSCKRHIYQTKGTTHSHTWVSSHYRVISDEIKARGRDIALDGALSEGDRTAAVDVLLMPYFKTL
jgi:hypothetical protein